jgi:hypothetical protein
MKLMLLAGVLSACASSLHSEIVASLGRSPTGVLEIRVRNKSAVALQAFAVAMNPSREAEDQTQFVIFSDTLIDQAGTLGPEVERALPVLQRSRRGQRTEDLFELPVITAGILADGTTTGDAVLLNRLMLRRSNMLLAVETALETLSDAGARNVPRHELIQQFRRMGDAVWRWYVPPEQQIGRNLYRSLAEKLQNIPEAPAGSPFPPSAFVAEQTAALNRQRTALLQSRPGLATAALIRSR